MKINKKMDSVALAAVLILFLILVLSTASAATEQSTSSAGQYAYITNGGNGTVSVIDTITDKVTATVPVGSYPYGVAVSSDEKKVYVANLHSKNVSVIDTAKNKVTATVPVGEAPLGIAINPGGSKVYVSNHNSSNVSVIDTATNTVTAKVKVGNYPIGIAVNSDGSRVYVTNVKSNTVSIINTATNKVIATVSVGTSPFGVIVTSNGKKVYVTNAKSNSVSVIDTATNKVTATMNVGDYPKGVALNPDGSRVYVTNAKGNTVSVINTATNKVIATVPVGNGPEGVAVSLDGKKVYVANSGNDDPGDAVSVINTATNKVITTVPVGNGPIAFGQFIVSFPAQSGFPVAAFSAKPASGNAPLKITFTDKSIGSPTSWKWIFGDGTYSTVKNPVHTYTKAGKYTVSLTVKNAKGSNTKTITNYIVVKAVAIKPIAAFSVSQRSGKAPLKVQFTDRSSNVPTNWKWSFGDGTYSTVKSPAHTYSKTGKYTVKLTATNSAGSSTVTKSSYIKVMNTVKPVAAFSASPTSGTKPLKVKFADKSTGSPTSWKWSFGDGTTSTTHNPLHMYTKKGKFTVTLTVKNAAGSSTKTMTSYITVK